MKPLCPHCSKRLCPVSGCWQCIHPLCSHLRSQALREPIAYTILWTEALHHSFIWVNNKHDTHRIR